MTGTETKSVLSTLIALPVTDLERSTRFSLRGADVEESRRELEARGVVVAGDTFDTSVGHMAHFSDPDGNVLMLHCRYAPPAHAA